MEELLEALRVISEGTLKNDQALLKLINEIIEKHLALQERVVRLERTMLEIHPVLN